MLSWRVNKGEILLTIMSRRLGYMLLMFLLQDAVLSSTDSRRHRYGGAKLKYLRIIT